MDSPVLYHSATLRGETRIRVRFNRAGDGAKFLVQALAHESSLLGDIAPFPVCFSTGDSRDLWVSLHPRCPAGVAAEDQRWRWQWKVNAEDAWQDLAQSEHRIYAIFGWPGSPWSAKASAAAAWPWATALEVACQWMRGATCCHNAADLLVGNIQRLGLFRHNGGHPRFLTKVERFRLQPFLDAIRGVADEKLVLDCQDAATIVTTLTNLVGGRLAQARIEGEPGKQFGLNDRVCLGGNELQNRPPYFNFHEVAWRGRAGPSGVVWDLCSQLAPTGLVFGRPGDGGYLDRMVAPPDRKTITVSKRRRNRPIWFGGEERVLEPASESADVHERGG
jgi:hypothetical protein